MWKELVAKAIDGIGMDAVDANHRPTKKVKKRGSKGTGLSKKYRAIHAAWLREEDNKADGDKWCNSEHGQKVQAFYASTVITTRTHTHTFTTAVHRRTLPQ